MYDKEFSASIVIACQGQSEAKLVKTPFGEIRSREGALLKYVLNDARGVFEEWSKDTSLPKEAHILLENPTKKEVKEAIHKISDILKSYDQDNTGIDFYFAGHGESTTGSLVLIDGILTAHDLLICMSDSITTGVILPPFLGQYLS